MAETAKLSVGKVLEKLRDTEASRSKMTRLNEETEAVKEEIRRLRAARYRLERNELGSSTQDPKLSSKR